MLHFPCFIFLCLPDSITDLLRVSGHGDEDPYPSHITEFNIFLKIHFLCEQLAFCWHAPFNDQNSPSKFCPPLHLLCLILVSCNISGLFGNFTVWNHRHSFGGCLLNTYYRQQAGQHAREAWGGERLRQGGPCLEVARLVEETDGHMASN